jgi:hypothetical protein
MIKKFAQALCNELQRHAQRETGVTWWRNKKKKLFLSPMKNERNYLMKKKKYWGKSAEKIKYLMKLLQKYTLKKTETEKEMWEKKSKWDSRKFFLNWKFRWIFYQKFSSKNLCESRRNYEKKTENKND